MATELEAHKEHLDVLNGATIIEATALDDTDGIFQVLLVRTRDDTILQIEVYCDPEGNGPGHLHINEYEDR